MQSLCGRRCKQQQTSNGANTQNESLTCEVLKNTSIKERNEKRTEDSKKVCSACWAVWRASSAAAADRRPPVAAVPAFNENINNNENNTAAIGRGGDNSNTTNGEREREEREKTHQQQTHTRSTFCSTEATDSVTCTGTGTSGSCSIKVFSEQMSRTARRMCERMMSDTDVAKRSYNNKNEQH